MGSTNERQGFVIKKPRKVNIGGNRNFRLIVGLSTAHGVKHFYQQALILLLPHIRDSLALSDVAVGGIVAVRAIAMGVMNVPAGAITDMFRRRVALMLAVSMVCLSLGYFVLGIANQYLIILVAVAITAAGTSLWHAPAFSSLASRYPDRKAFVFALHRSGGSIGDTVAPLVLGVLLGGISFWGLAWGGLTWRAVALLHVGPSVLTAITIIVMFKSPESAQFGKITLGQYFASVRPLLVNTKVISMVLLSGLRGMAHQSLLVFLVIYMKDSLHDGGLGYSDFTVGYHVALLTLLGILASPLMGFISDKIGRRPVIFVAMCVATASILSFYWASSGLPFTLVLGLLGVVIFAINPVMTAGAMDAVKGGTEGTTVAMLFTGGAIIGALSPLVAGLVFTNWYFHGVVLYAGSIAGLGALLALVLPMGMRSQAGKESLR